MNRRRNFNLLLNALTCFAMLLMITACVGGELSSETEAFFDFVKAVDPQNVLRVSLDGRLPNPCSEEWKGVKCNFKDKTVTQIWLESLNLGGTIDADSLCKLQNLQVLSLAKNHIQGNIPYSISCCRKLSYLNLSSNLLSGKIPVSLTKLRHLRTLDISNNNVKSEFKHLNKYSMKKKPSHVYSNLRKLLSYTDAESPNGNFGIVLPPSVTSIMNETTSGGKKWFQKVTNYILVALGVAVLVVFFALGYFVNKNVSRMSQEREILKSLAHSPQKTTPPPPAPPEPREETKPEERCSELVFFVEEKDRFNMDDLLEATADLQSQSLCSSLYKVKLKDNAVYAVKRLKKLQVSFEEFGQTMKQIGNLKHPNILPLVAYNSTKEEKLLIYKYQINGSLLNLLEEYIEGKRELPWKLRLLIATGIARGLDFIYQNSDIHKIIIPHGNLKLSNIMLDENGEPLISEYGYSKFLDPKRTCMFSSNGYTAPEKTLSEQGDVFSFGILLLELLTGKTVEKSGIDLPKWVRSMVREEWTGEVFDKEVNRVGREYAFPLLNVALKCVSDSPEDRPTMAEVMEKIDEVVNAHEDFSISTIASIDSSPPDCCLLHTVIPETWDTPGSNY